MVAHEIRSPMNSVLAQLKVVLDGLAGDLTEKQQELLTKASEKIMSLVTLSSELLDLARIESGLITQEREQLDLFPLLVDQVTFYQASAQEKKISLDLKKPPELPMIMGNRYNLEEVLSNLINNAIKYTPEGGKITVSAGVEKTYLCISVRDSGYGIPEDEIGRVFDRFYRVKNDQTRYITGTGLGLAIVKSIMEAHNGMVRAVSEPGHGSTFSIYIPMSNS